MLGKWGRLQSMDKISVTVVVNIPGEKRTQIFTRYFDSLSELSDSLPGLDGESWNITLAPRGGPVER